MWFRFVAVGIHHLAVNAIGLHLQVLAAVDLVYLLGFKQHRILYLFIGAFIHAAYR